MRQAIAWLYFQSLPAAINSLVRLACHSKDPCGMVFDDEQQWFEFFTALSFSNGFLATPQARQNEGVPIMSQPISGVEFYGTPPFFLRCGPVRIVASPDD